MSRNSTRRLGLAFALVGAAALTAPALAGATTGSLGSSDAAGFTCSALSTEATPDGWGIPFDDEKNQLAFYSDTKVLDDDGSLKLEIVKATPDNRSAWYHSAGSIPLADAVKNEIGFAEKAATSQTSFQLRLTGTTNPAAGENGFATLYWVANGNDSVDTTTGGTHANIQNGKWISTRDIEGAPKNVPSDLDDIIAGNPGATIEHYGVSVGRGEIGTSTHVDAVKFNGCTTNFAKNDPETSTGSLGSLGNIFGSLSAS
jgi:hypothetical protein